VSDAVEQSTPRVWPQGSTAARVGPRAAAIDRLYARLTAIALILCVASDVFGGVARFAMSQLGVPFVLYLPFVFSGGLAAAYFIYQTTASRLDLRIFAILGFFVLYTIYSLVIGVADGGARPDIVAFSLYTWTPFFLGLVLAIQGAETRLVRHVPLWWASAIVGVIVNYFVHFPWTGSTFEVLGQQSDVARGWTTNGLERLAGFSRASFTAANEIAVFGILLVSRPKTRWTVRVIVWILSLAAVALTTTKTALVAILFVPLMLRLQQTLQHRYGRRFEGRFYLAMATLAALSAVMVMLPGSSATGALLSKYSFDVSFLTLSSMQGRADDMWPRAFALITADHNALEWVFGRGLGGIGAAQYIFDPLNSNAADNMFVFLYVTFGANCIVFAVAIFSRFGAVFREGGSRFELFFALAATLLMLGMTTNVIESVVPAIALGILAGKSYPSQLGRDPQPNE